VEFDLQSGGEFLAAPGAVGVGAHQGDDLLSAGGRPGWPGLVAFGCGAGAAGPQVQRWGGDGDGDRGDDGGGVGAGVVAGLVAGGGVPSSFRTADPLGSSTERTGSIARENQELLAGVS
jgi:hypothetical protein